MPRTQESNALVAQLKAQADAQVDAYTKVSEGHKIILDRLNGIAETPAADYVAIRATLETEKNAHEATKMILADKQTAPTYNHK